MSEDDEFLRQFAVQIATALREKEDMSAEQQRQTSIGDSVEDLYRSLVFDEPLIDHIPNLPVVSSALSRQLLSLPAAPSVSTPTSSYALSNRLVNGIVYLCNKNTASIRQKVKESKAENEKSSSTKNRHTLNGNERPSHSAEQVAMAKLGFCIFVDIPLQCCRDNSSSQRNLKKIRHLLGSFKGTTTSKIMRHDHEYDIATTKSQDLDCKVHDEAKLDAARNQNDNPPADKHREGTEEVWAADSDPSDYDYGEGDDVIDGRNSQQEEQQPEHDIDWLDPNVLSKPDPNLTLQETRDAIGSLLQLASYSLLEPIFFLPQNEITHYVSQLTQLILVLLQPRKHNNKSISPSEDESLLLDASMDQVLLSPLWILRDAATYHNNSTMGKSASSNYEQSYLRVLQTLLAMDQAYLQDVGMAITQSKEKPDLCVSSIVGLSYLSSWCANQKQPTQVTIDAIIDSMNDLEHIAERGRQIYKRKLTNTLISILDTLSGIHYDRLNINNATTSPYYKSSTIPQTLLNSGFLRQTLSLVATRNDENNDDRPVSSDFLGFHHALWGLCVAYPKIVGKYVFRYPGSSQIIRSYAMQLDSSAPQHCVQCILWNIYGWLQCKESSASGGGLNILRKPGSSSNITSVKLAEDECREVCQKAWSRLCNLVKKGLSFPDVEDDASSERVIEEWGRLLMLTSIPYIIEHFKTLVDPSLLNDISIVISNQLAHQSVRIIKSSNEDGKVDDEKDDKPSREQKIISQAHKLLKKYNLFFQGTVIGSSKTD